MVAANKPISYYDKMKRIALSLPPEQLAECAIVTLIDLSSLLSVVDIDPRELKRRVEAYRGQWLDVPEKVITNGAETQQMLLRKGFGITDEEHRKIIGG